MARQQQLQHVVIQASSRYVGQQRQHACDRLFRFGIDGEFKLCRKPGGTQHAHRVFAVAGFGVTDHHHTLFANVVQAAHEIMQRFIVRVVVKRVHGEIAPHRIVLARSEHVVPRETAMLVSARLVFIGRSASISACVGMAAAVGGHFDRLVTEHDVNDAKAPANDACTAEDRPNLLGSRVGGDVEVLRVLGQQQVAHGTPDNERIVPCGVKPFAGLEGGARNVISVNVVVAGSVHPPLAFGPALAGRTVSAKHFFDDATDHGSKSMMGHPCVRACSRSTASGFTATG